jgi:predicted dehydrogenase
MKFVFRGFFFLLVSLLFLAADAPAAENEPLRVAIAGLVHGHAGGFFSMAAHRTDVKIVGISDPDRTVFDKYAKKFGLDASLYHSDLEEMLNATHPQAVLAYSNTFDHRKIVELCAKHRVAVMMEKPLAVSAADALAMEKAARDAKIVVLVNYFTTWVPSNHAAYDVVHAGAIGEVRKVVVHSGHSGPKEIGVGPEFLSWLTDPTLNGAGALYDFGCYGADLTTWLMDGQPPLTVTAITQHIKPDVYPKVEDEATIILTYPKAQAIIQASWNWAIGRQDMEIYGKTGYVLTSGDDTVKIRKGDDKSEISQPAQKIAAPADDELSYLRAILLNGVKPEGLSSLETNVTVAEIMDAARESAATGKTIKFAYK